MAEKTNKGMNFLFTPTLIEFEKTISLPMLSKNFRRIQFLFCHFCQIIQIKVWIISQQALIRTIRRIYTRPSLIHQLPAMRANPKITNVIC